MRRVNSGAAAEVEEVCRGRDTPRDFLPQRGAHRLQKRVGLDKCIIVQCVGVECAVGVGKNGLHGLPDLSQLTFYLLFRHRHP